MKNIEVTDEMYSELVELAKEYVSQDNRGTRMPYLFQVMEKKEVHYKCADEGNFQIWRDEDIIVETFEDFKAYLSCIDFYFTDEEEIVIEQIFESWNEEYLFRDEEIGRDEFLEKYCPDLKEGSYDYEYVFSNAFFTAKGCKEHIQANKYNLSCPTDYLNYANRNPEMELLSEFLCEINKVE